jgi:hypothetical protein
LNVFKFPISAFSVLILPGTNTLSADVPNTI